MSVSSIIGGGIRLIRAQPQVVAIWTVLYVVVITLFSLAMRPFMAAMMAAQQQTAANAAIGVKAPPVFPMEAFRNLFGMELIVALLLVVAFAAVVRAVANPVGDRFAYLRVGLDELRLIGLGLLLTILLFLAEILGILVIGLFVALATFLVGKTGAVVIGVLLGIALICAVLYAQVRISLIGALTVIEGRFALKDTWRATKGRFWTLFGAYLSMALILLVIGIAWIAITQPSLLTAYAQFSQQAMQTAAQQQLKAQNAGISFAYVARIVVGAIIGAPLYCVFFGAIATAAVEFGGIRSTIAAEFD